MIITNCMMVDVHINSNIKWAMNVSSWLKVSKLESLQQQRFAGKHSTTRKRPSSWRRDAFELRCRDYLAEVALTNQYVINIQINLTSYFEREMKHFIPHFSRGGLCVLLSRCSTVVQFALIYKLQLVVGERVPCNSTPFNMELVMVIYYDLLRGTPIREFV
uniref:Uncharacterized protein n=1 Tax=Strigamia maritima TaxID=126957 RepID=T1J9G8_STRMM